MISGRPTHMPDHAPSDRRSIAHSGMAPASEHGRSRTYRVRELERVGR